MWTQAAVYVVARSCYTRSPGRRSAGDDQVLELRLPLQGVFAGNTGGVAVESAATPGLT